MDQKMELNRPILPTAISYVVSAPILRSSSPVRTRPYLSETVQARKSGEKGPGNSLNDMCLYEAVVGSFYARLDKL